MQSVKLIKVAATLPTNFVKRCVHGLASSFLHSKHKRFVKGDSLGECMRPAYGRWRLAIANFLKACFGETPKPARETRALPSTYFLRAAGAFAS
jgi:hypothetical protein